jgi:hypothetical protein
MIGPAGFQQAPQAVSGPSIAFVAGQNAKQRGEKLATSALKNLRPGCRQYDDFIAGYDSEIDWSSK